MSEIPKETEAAVLDALDTRAVLEYLAYRPDTIQETDKTVRCFCPVHKESVVRTLTIDKESKRGKCLYTPCPARKPTNLIKLVALAKGIEDDEALIELVQRFGIKVEVPGVADMLEKRLDAASMDLAAGDLEKAAAGFKHVLSVQSENIVALEGLANVYEQLDKKDELPKVLKKLAALHFRQENYQAAASVYEQFLQKAPRDIETRLRFAECLHRLDRKEAMLAEMFQVARLFEETDETDKALEIYHRIETLKPANLDVSGNVIDLLVKVGRADEAIEQLAEHAREFRAARRVDDALEAYLQILDIDPQRDEYRAHFIQTVLDAPAEDDRNEETREVRVLACLEQIEAFGAEDAVGRGREALEALRRRFPGNILVMEKLYERYKALGRDEEANQLRDALVETYVAAGREFLERQSLDEAREPLQRALELRPDSIDALEVLVRVVEEKGEADERTALQKRLADALAGERRFERAIPLFEKYLEINPEDMAARLQLVECLHNVGRGAEMIGELKNVADKFVKKKRIEEAVDIYRRIAAIDPENQEVQDLLVELLVKAGRGGEAADQISRQADHYRVEGEIEKAIERYRQVLDLDPNRDDIRLKYVQTRVAQPDLPQDGLVECLGLIDGFVQEEWGNMALQILEDLRSRFPGNTVVLGKIYQVYRANNRDNDADALAFDLAQNYMDAEEFDAALKWIDILVERGGPGLVIALTLKANICGSMGRSDEAIAALMRIIDDHEGRGEYDEALPFYESVIEVDPENLELRRRHIHALTELRLARELNEACAGLLPLLVRHPDREKALSIVQAMIARSPQNADYTLAAAEILSGTGNDDEARRIMMRAAELLAESDDNARAIQILERLVAMDPHDLAAIEKLADFQLNIGKNEEALGSYKSLAQLYGEQGSLDAQLDVMLKISEVRPDDTEIHKSILTLYEQLGNTRDAKELREKMIRLYVARKNWTDALQLCRDSIEDDPADLFALECSVRIHDALDQPDALRESALRLLQIYRARGDADKAAKLLDLLEGKFPDDRAILELRLEARCAAGDWTAAIQALERVVDIHEKNHNTAASIHLVASLFEKPDAPAAALVPLWMDLLRESGSHEENWPVTERALTLLERGQQSVLALDVLEDILREAPEFDAPRQRQVDALLTAGRREEAVLALREWARGRAAADQIEAADALFNKAAQIDPDNQELLAEILEFRAENRIQGGAADIAERLADIHQNEGLVTRSMRVLEMGLRAEPARADLRRRLLQLDEQLARPEALRERYNEHCAAQIAAQDYDLAQTTLTEAVSVFPWDVELRLKLVDTLKALDLKGEVLADLSAIAAIQAERNEIAEALQTIERIVEIDGENRKARAMEAEIREKLNNDQTALVEFRKLADKLGAESPEKLAVLLASNATTRGEESLEMLPLLKEYTFENFVVGARNNFAHATAMAVSRTPGGDYNPLFLYGDVGLGKTHLLHAIANEIVRQKPDARLLYTSSEEFTNALIESIQNNTIRQFRALHKSPDVFLIDDIHGLAEKERAQEEFFQIFNALYQANKQIVMTSDRPPKEIAHLERRLRSRFGAGIIVDIAPPDFETRVAILRHILAEAEASMDDDVVTQLAQTIESNIRELKSAVIQILARLKLTQEKPTPEMVRQIVDQIREN